jgi:putative ABC transport system substrate-binding protein
LNLVWLARAKMRFIRLTRREFIGLLGGAATAWPLAAWAQMRDRMRRIGMLMPTAADDRDAQDRIAALLQGLQQLGWTVGRNMRMEYRWETGNVDAMRKSASSWWRWRPTSSLPTAAPPWRRCGR